MKKSLKVLLINPPSKNCTVTTVGWNLAPEDLGSFPPISLMYVASSLKVNSNHEVSILDAVFEDLNFDEIKRRIEDYSPDVVGITSFTPIFYDVMKVVKIVKEVNPKTHVTIGGAHASAYSEETIAKPEVDSLVLGEGEYIYPKLIDALAYGNPLETVEGVVIKVNGEIKRIGKPGYIENLDDLPFPAFDLLPYKEYFSTIGSGNPVGTICSSRGCPYSCTFCCKPYRTYRTRSSQNIIGEMKLYYERGIKEFFFFDDMFNVTPKRVIAISQEILESGMNISWSFRGRVDSVTEEMLRIAKESGCKQIMYGVEAASNEGLRAIKKDITIEQVRNALKLTRKAKIESSTNWMIGFPHDKSRKEIEHLISTVRKLDSDYAQFNVLIPYEGTEIFEEGVKRGILKKEFWRDYVNNPQPKQLVPIWEEYMSRNELSKYLEKCYRHFYFRPKNVIRNLFKIRDLGYLKSRIRGFFILLGFGGYKKRASQFCGID